MSGPSANATASARGGVGFLSLLTLVLVAGKIFADAPYSWLVAFSPSILLIVLVVLVLTCFTALFIADERARTKNQRERKKKGYRTL